MNTFLNRWLPFVLCLIFIFTLSSFSSPYRILYDISQELPNGKLSQEFFIQAMKDMRDGSNHWSGSVAHFLEFAALGFFCARAILWQQPIYRQKCILIFIICWIYALSDEIHQIFVPGRTFQIQDLVFDTLGILTGMFLYQRLREKQQPAHRNDEIAP